MTAISQQAADPVQHDPTSDFGGKDVDNLIYIISHDVRNSVRALIEIPQWIAEDLVAAGTAPDADMRTNLSMLTTHARRLDRMMHDLLVFSRVGRMQELRDIDLAAAVETVLSQIDLPRGMDVTTNLRTATVQMGERDILTLLAALIGNAVKHHHAETGRIEISAEVDGDDVILAVEDDGPGIPKAQRARVTEAMQTMRPRDEVEGSGMGLAIARKIAEIHRGQLRIGEAARGTGTRVEIRIPGRVVLN